MPSSFGATALSAERRTARRSLPWIAFLVVVVASIAYQVHEGTTSDVSWLITARERMLDGRTAYVDFFELNPPASVLLYLPAIAAARLCHIAPEAAVKGFVYLVLAANVALCRATGGQGRLSLAALAAIWLLLPGDVFAQREHFIGLFLLPLLGVLTARARGCSPGRMPAILAGIEAGMAVAIKPYFLLALVLPAAFLLWRHRAAGFAAFRTLLAPEAVAFMLTAVGYVVTVFACFPAYLSGGLPIALDVYSLYTNPHLAFLYSWNAILCACAAGLAWLSSPRGDDDAELDVMLLAAFGCVGAVMVQAKYFDYHAYPSIALALTALGSALARRLAHRPRPSATASLAYGAAATIIFCRAVVWFAAPAPDAALRRAMAALSPHPRIMALSMGHGLAHPLVRDIGGTFVGRLASPWMYFLIKRAFRDRSLPAERRSLLQGYIDLEKRVTALDIVRERPDYILVSKAFDTDRKVETWPFIDENWRTSTPALVAAFAHYAPVDTIGDVTIWARKEASVNGWLPRSSR